MDEALNRYIENHEQELFNAFLKVKSLESEFEVFCFEQFNEHEQDYNDYAYEQFKDRKLEQEAEE